MQCEIATQRMQEVIFDPVCSTQDQMMRTMLSVCLSVCLFVRHSSRIFLRVCLSARLLIFQRLLDIRCTIVVQSLSLYLPFILFSNLFELTSNKYSFIKQIRLEFLSS